jgi:mono/diheme cytochrome c family protein
MKTVVYPKMKEEFIGYDAKRYGEMTCITCHGDGAKDGSFKMPNPKLPKLPGDEAGFKALAAKMPAAAKFMGTHVVPAMAKMLGEAPYDPQTQKGFGCFECHTK